MGFKQIIGVSFTCRHFSTVQGWLYANVTMLRIMRACRWRWNNELHKMSDNLILEGYTFPVYLVSMKSNPGKRHLMVMEQLD